MRAEPPLGQIAQSMPSFGWKPLADDTGAASLALRRSRSSSTAEVAGLPVVRHSQIPLMPAAGTAAIVLRLDIRHGCSSNAVPHKRFRRSGTESGDPRWGGSY
jgi:hypothetical protein